MSYTEMSDVRSMNDAKFDANIKFGDKKTSKRFETQIGRRQCYR